MAIETADLQKSMQRQQGGQDLVSSTEAAPMPDVITDTYQRTRQYLAGGGVMEPAVDYNRQYDELLGAQASLAGALMQGRIPLDVQRSIRQAASEKGLSAGLGAGSQASRFLVARDLGLTSLSLMEKGIETAQKVGELAQTQRQSLLDYLKDLRTQDLAGSELRESSRKTNLEARLTILQTMTTALQNYHSIGATYATSETADESSATALTSDYQNLLKSLKSALGGGQSPGGR